MSDDLRCDKHPERRVPCFLCVSKNLDEWPLPKSGMTAAECLAVIERDRIEMRTEIDRLMGIVGDAMQEITTLRAQLAEARDRVLRPLSAAEVEAALHEGRAEAMAATGDNAWTSLLKQRDHARSLCLEAVGIAEAVTERLSKIGLTNITSAINRLSAIRAEIEGGK